MIAPLYGFMNRASGSELSCRRPKLQTSDSSWRPEGLVDMSSTKVWNNDPTPRALFLLGSIQNLWVTWLLSLNPSNQAHWEGLVVSPITLSGHGSCPPGLGHQLWMTFSKAQPEAVIYLTISIMCNVGQSDKAILEALTLEINFSWIQYTTQ